MGSAVISFLPTAGSVVPGWRTPLAMAVDPREPEKCREHTDTMIVVILHGTVRSKLKKLPYRTELLQGYCLFFGLFEGFSPVYNGGMVSFWDSMESSLRSHKEPNQ